MLGNFGQRFQALSAQAQAFHEQFVTLLNTSAGAYLSAEAANVEQILGNAAEQVAGEVGQSLNGAVSAIQNGGAAALDPGLLTGFNTFEATVAGPYQTLVANTAANLQGLNSAVNANPAPFLHQLVSNQMAYGQTIATALEGAVQNFPADLASVPAALQAVLAANPAAVVQQFIIQQAGYNQTITTALTNAAQDFANGIGTLPAAYQAALQALMAGDVPGAVGDIATGFGNLFLTSLNANQDLVTGLITITPVGTLGDLLPILAIPGQVAQNFTNLLPTASIPRQLSQNLTNLIVVATDTSQTLDLTTGALHVGLPLVLGLDAIGPAVTTLNAFGSSANAFISALQTGDGLGAAAALLDAPAAIANGFLNGQATLPLSVSLGDLTTTTNLPLGGILTPPEFASLTLTIFGTTGTIPLIGTTFGGIVPALLTFLPEQLAQAIGAPILA